MGMLCAFGDKGIGNWKIVKDDYRDDPLLHRMLKHVLKDQY